MTDQDSSQVAERPVRNKLEAAYVASDLYGLGGAETWILAAFPFLAPMQSPSSWKAASRSSVRGCFLDLRFRGVTGGTDMVALTVTGNSLGVQRRRFSSTTNARAQGDRLTVRLAASMKLLSLYYHDDNN